MLDIVLSIAFVMIALAVLGISRYAYVRVYGPGNRRLVLRIALGYSLTSLLLFVACAYFHYRGSEHWSDTAFVAIFLAFSAMAQHASRATIKRPHAA